MQGRQKIQALAIIPGGDSAPLFQFVEGSLNQVALPIQFPVVFPSWTLRISSGVSKGIYKSVVQSDREFLRIGVGDR